MTIQTSPLRLKDPVATLYSPPSSSGPDSPRSPPPIQRLQFRELSPSASSTETVAHNISFVSSASSSSTSVNRHAMSTRASTRKRKEPSEMQRNSITTSSESELEARVTRLEQLLEGTTKKLDEANKKVKQMAEGAISLLQIIAEEAKKRKDSELCMVLASQAILDRVIKLELFDKVQQETINLLGQSSLAQSAKLQLMQPFIIALAKQVLEQPANSAQETPHLTT